jgi:hypothetical protein
MELEKIIYKNEVLAIFYPKKLKGEGGVTFLTPQDYPLQVGIIEHSESKTVQPHIHRDLKYNVNTTLEFLYVEEGRGVEITLYAKDWTEVKKITLSAGDSILFVSGGHGLKIPKRCRIFEIKQGPYPGDKEAKIFKQ